MATLDTVDPNEIDIYNVVLNLTKQSFTKVQTWNIGPNVSPIAAVDLNGDGLADLVVGFAGSYSPKLNGGYAVLINKGDGTFNAPTSVALPGDGIIAMAIADLNHDLKPDLIALEQPPNGGKFQVGIFLGDGKGGFTAKKTYPLKGFAISVVAADLNDDGHPDLIFYDGELLLGNSDGTFKTGKALPLPTSVASLVAADFNQFFGSKSPSCPGSNQHESFNQSFSVTIGSTAFPLSTVNLVERGVYSGTFHVDVTVQTP